MSQFFLQQISCCSLRPAFNTEVSAVRFPKVRLYFRFGYWVNSRRARLRKRECIWVSLRDEVRNVKASRQPPTQTFLAVRNYALHVLFMPRLSRLSVGPHWHVVYTQSFSGNISNYPCSFLVMYSPTRKWLRIDCSRCGEDRQTALFPLTTSLIHWTEMKAIFPAIVAKGIFLDEAFICLRSCSQGFYFLFFQRKKVCSQAKERSFSGFALAGSGGLCEKRKVEAKKGETGYMRNRKIKQ